MASHTSHRLGPGLAAVSRRALTLTFVLAACRSATDASDHSPSSAVPAPPPAPSELRMFARALSPQCPQPNDTVSPGPAVLVTDERGRAQQGVAVRFETVTGRVERSEVETGADGVASAGSWTLGESADVDVLIARIPGGPSLTFSVTTRLSALVIAVYDLTSIGGQPLPISFPGAGTVTGAHYVLAADSTYSFQYEYSGQVAPRTARLCSNARYTPSPTKIDFYLAPGSYPQSSFYQDRNGHFATATPSGRTMSVTYDDTIDFEDEQYELESSFNPIALDRVSSRGQLMTIPGSTTLRLPVAHAQSAHRP